MAINSNSGAMYVFSRGLFKMNVQVYMDMLTLCTYSVTVCSNVIITLSSKANSSSSSKKSGIVVDGMRGTKWLGIQFLLSISYLVEVHIIVQLFSTFWSPLGIIFLCKVICGR